MTYFQGCNRRFSEVCRNLAWNPRRKIPWFPTIDQKCVGCAKCVVFCSLGTFAIEEKDGNKRAVAKNPNNCVVLCSGCASIGPAVAIKHPSKKEYGENIKALRENPDLKLRKHSK
jgi:NAD-dependent dihydropyrimidine dehydrogenase PreA subunit